MLNLDSKETIMSLAEMRDELNSVKNEAEEMKQDIIDINPENFSDIELPKNLGDTKKVKELKSPADVKMILNEAVSDLQNVIDNLDAICGQAENEIKEVSYKRMSSKYASDLSVLGMNADKAVKDGKDAINHWAFLTRSLSSTKSIKDSSLKQAAETIKEVNKFTQLLQSLGFKKESTAVPPTGAKFTGDKWPDKGDPVKVEQSAWEKGNSKFKNDKSFEDKRPNPSVDNRLTDVDYGRFEDTKPFVNASFRRASNAMDSYWDIVDIRSGKRIIASFRDTPSNLGPKTEAGFSRFASKNYASKIISSVREFGIETVQKELNAKTASFKEGLRKMASDDTSSVKKYYSEAYGDKNYAKDLVADKSKSSGNSKHYTPEYESANFREAGEKRSFGRKSVALSDKKSVTNQVESGKNFSVNSNIIQAKARRAVDVARKFASVGAIPFTRQAVASKAQELLKMSEEAFKATLATISLLPITNQAALKLGHLPDSEIGIVGNTSTSVSSPKSNKLNSEGIDPNVKSDATISKSASFIPQTTNLGNGKLELTDMFTTTQNALKNKGINLEAVRKPQYRQ